MGLLDSVIGALSGIHAGGARGDLLNAVLALLADDGDGPGIAEVMARFQQSGMADVVGSWIGVGANLPISGDALRQVLGPDSIERIAQQVGLSQAATVDRLSQMLPYVVDKLTPTGHVPETGLGDIGELMGRMGGR
jgi:uncharacterized protein YidB (DUF937 family)